MFQKAGLGKVVGGMGLVWIWIYSWGVDRAIVPPPLKNSTDKCVNVSISSEAVKTTSQFSWSMLIAMKNRKDSGIFQRYVAGGEESACLPVGRLLGKSAGKGEYTLSSFSFFQNISAVLTISAIIFNDCRKLTIFTYSKKDFHVFNKKSD